MDERIVEGATASVLIGGNWEDGVVEQVHPGHTASLGSTPGTVTVKTFGGGRARVEPGDVRVHEG
jgi:hypothetical protein